MRNNFFCQISLRSSAFCFTSLFLFVHLFLVTWKCEAKWEQNQTNNKKKATTRKIKATNIIKRKTEQKEYTEFWANCHHLVVSASHSVQMSGFTFFFRLILFFLSLSFSFRYGCRIPTTCWQTAKRALCLYSLPYTVGHFASHKREK